MDKLMDVKIKKPSVYFSPKAWMKMTGLVTEASTEIGWHGIVERKDNIFIVKDIVVYPQTVTGTTVTTDDLEYGNWLMQFDDETFHKIRFQGHSHVWMGTSPSGVDDNFYNNILQTMDEDDYYIFMIINKRNEVFINIYDFTQNTIFEKEDITLATQCGNTDLNTWLKEQIKQHVKTYTVNNTANTASETIKFPDKGIDEFNYYGDGYYGKQWSERRTRGGK